MLDAWGVGFDVVPGVAPGAAETWLARRPLHGRRVLVTRPRAQAGRLAALLEAHGAEVVALPTIQIGPPDDWAPLDRAIRDLETLPVGRLHQRERRGGVPGAARRTPGWTRGASAAAAWPRSAPRRRTPCGAGGIEPDLMPAEYRAEGLVEALRSRAGRGDARAAGARGRGSGGLAAGAGGARRAGDGRPGVPHDARKGRRGPRSHPPRVARDRRRHLHQLVDGARVPRGCSAPADPRRLLDGGRRGRDRADHRRDRRRAWPAGERHAHGIHGPGARRRDRRPLRDVPPATVRG